MGKKKMLKIELENIIRDKRIYPVFQSIVELETGRIAAYEALSRITGECRHEQSVPAAPRVYQA